MFVFADEFLRLHLTGHLLMLIFYFLFFLQKKARSIRLPETETFLKIASGSSLALLQKRSGK